MTNTVFFETDIGLRHISELVNVYKMRTPEQKSRKMLNEEMIIMDLEMAIKKEQFRKTQNNIPEIREVPKKNPGQQLVSIPVPELDAKNENMLNRIRSKIGF